jgi:hypothetical protein
MGTISTAIPSAEYQPLLDAVLAAAEICAKPRVDRVPETAGFGLAALSRWAANAQAFVLLRNGNFLADAYGMARIGSELAIITAWVQCGDAGRFKTPADRVRALIEDGTYSTRVWLDKMHERDPSRRRYDETTSWGRALIASKKPGIPKLWEMAECSDITRDQYAFAYRGESGAVHSAAGVLAAHAAGQPPLDERRMLHNVLVAALIVFGAVSELMDDDRARSMAMHLQEAVKERVTPKDGR